MKKKRWFGGGGRQKATQQAVQKIPPLLDVLCTFLRENCTELHGIFRVSGSFEETKTLKKFMEKNVQKKDFSIDLTKYDPHVVAGVVKMYFRDMPQPLMTFELYEAFIAATSITESPEERLACLRKVVKQLPPRNYVMLVYLTNFLKCFAAKSSINAMTTTNLSICFTPSLLWPEKETIEVMFGHATCAHTVFESIMDHSSYMFEKLAPEKKVVPTSNQAKEVLGTLTRNALDLQMKMMMEEGPPEGITQEDMETIIKAQARGRQKRVDYRALFENDADLNKDKEDEDKEKDKSAPGGDTAGAPDASVAPPADTPTNPLNGPISSRGNLGDGALECLRMRTALKDNLGVPDASNQLLQQLETQFTAPPASAAPPTVEIVRSPTAEEEIASITQELLSTVVENDSQPSGDATAPRLEARASPGAARRLPPQQAFRGVGQPRNPGQRPLNTPGTAMHTRSPSSPPKAPGSPVQGPPPRPHSPAPGLPSLVPRSASNSSAYVSRKPFFEEGAADSGSIVVDDGQSPRRPKGVLAAMAKRKVDQAPIKAHLRAQGEHEQGGDAAGAGAGSGAGAGAGAIIDTRHLPIRDAAASPLRGGRASPLRAGSSDAIVTAAHGQSPGATGRLKDEQRQRIQDQLKMWGGGPAPGGPASSKRMSITHMEEMPKASQPDDKKKIEDALKMWAGGAKASEIKEAPAQKGHRRSRSIGGRDKVEARPEARPEPAAGANKQKIESALKMWAGDDVLETPKKKK